MVPKPIFLFLKTDATVKCQLAESRVTNVLFLAHGEQCKRLPKCSLPLEKWNDLYKGSVRRP